MLHKFNPGVPMIIQGRRKVQSTKYENLRLLWRHFRDVGRSENLGGGHVVSDLPKSGVPPASPFPTSLHLDLPADDLKFWEIKIPFDALISCNLWSLIETVIQWKICSVTKLLENHSKASILSDHPVVKKGLSIYLFPCESDSQLQNFN